MEEKLDHNDEQSTSPKMRKITARLCLAVFACVIGTTFQFGWSMGVLNTPQMLFQNEYKYGFNQAILSDVFDFNSTSSTSDIRGNNTSFNLTTTESPANQATTTLSDGQVTILWSLTVSIFGAGGMIGGFTGSYAATRLGRKRMMLLNNIILLAGCGLMVFAKLARRYELMIVGRLLMGVNSGYSMVVAQLYLNEISPVNFRGAFGVVSQLAMVNGIFLSQTLGISKILGVVDLYPWLFAVPAFGGLLQLVLLPLCPESPAWLYIENKNKDASTKALQKLLRVDDVQQELDRYEDEVQQGLKMEKAKYSDMFTKSWLRKPLLIAVVLHLSQRLSGIMAVMAYSTSIYTSADLSEENAQYATLGSTAVVILMSIVLIFLMDRVGRRPLHIAGLAGCLTSMIVITLALMLQARFPGTKYLSVFALILFVMSYSIGPGCIPWFVTAELFDQSARSHAVSITALFNWFAQFGSGLTFPLMQRELGFYCFIPFIVLLILFLIFTILKLPETKNMSVTEITALFKPNIIKECGDQLKSEIL